MKKKANCCLYSALLQGMRHASHSKYPRALMVKADVCLLYKSLMYTEKRMFWLLGSCHLISHWIPVKTSEAHRQACGKIAELRTFLPQVIYLLADSGDYLSS